MLYKLYCYVGNEDTKITSNHNLLRTQNAPVKTASALAGIQMEDL